MQYVRGHRRSNGSWVRTHYRRGPAAITNGKVTAGVVVAGLLALIVGRGHGSSLWAGAVEGAAGAATNHVASAATYSTLRTAIGDVRCLDL